MAKCIQQDGEFSALEATLLKCWKSDHAVYEVQITSHTDNIHWIFSKRYSEFLQLHDNMCKIDETVKNIYFPPKKPFNNLASKFLCKRRQELEEYLNKLLKKFPIPPPPLAQFIDWNVFEIHGITNLLARNFFENGDMILRMGFQFEFTALQIYSINERLLSQSPPNLTNSPCTDIVHVMEFVGQIRNVKITGSATPYHTSNIIMNKFELDMSRFNSIEKLELINIDLRQMRGFDKLKETVSSIKVSYSLDNIKILALGDLLSLGNGDWVFGRDSVPTNCWSKVEHLDLSNNYLHGLDPSMALFKRVKTIRLNNNLLVDVQHLEILNHLRVLNLSQNKLGLVYVSRSDVPEPTLRGRLGNITDLDLSHNQLCSTKLIEGLYSLVKLNLGSNLIEEMTELSSLQTLQCLTSLILLGNPVCSKSGYRKYTLQLFGERFSEVRLDLRVADDLELLQLKASISELSFKSQSDSKKSHSPPAQFTDNTQHNNMNNNEERSSKNLEVSIESEVNEIFIF